MPDQQSDMLASLRTIETTVIALQSDVKYFTTTQEKHSMHIDQLFERTNEQKNAITALTGRVDSVTEKLGSTLQAASGKWQRIASVASVVGVLLAVAIAITGLMEARYGG